MRNARGTSKNAGCICLAPETIHEAKKVDRKAEIIIQRLRFGRPKDVGRRKIQAPTISPETGAAMSRMSRGGNGANLRSVWDFSLDF
jgi:hypothetical protein